MRGSVEDMNKQFDYTLEAIDKMDRKIRELTKENLKKTKLIDACCEAIDNPKWKPRQVQTKKGLVWRTFCNFATNYICGRMGWKGFDKMMANEIVDKMINNKAWKEIPMSIAQRMANKGELVVAGAQKMPHGHVAVVRPGNAERSNKWRTMAPKICNVGFKNSIGVGVNWVFGDKPKFYMRIK